MEFIIDEKQVKDHAEEIIKQKISRKVNLIIEEWDFYKRIDNSIKECVFDFLKKEKIENVINQIQQDDLIKSISEKIAEDISDKLFRG